MRVAVSDQNNLAQDGVYQHGEVEDYLIRLVAPQAGPAPSPVGEPTLHTGDSEVEADISPTGGISVNSPQGGATGDGNRRHLGENSIHFPGSNDYLSLDDNNLFIHDAFTERTVAFWLYNEDNSGIQDLFDEGGSTHGFAMRLDNGVPKLTVRNSGTQVTVSGPESIPVGQWVLLTGVFDNGDLSLYVDGALAAQSTGIGFATIPAHGDAAGWGGTNGGSNAFGAINNNFNGWMDDLRVYDLPLGPADVAVLWEWTGGVAPGTQNLVAPNAGSGTQPADRGEAALSLFPNPTSGGINVSMEVQQAGPVHLSIMDMAGRQLLRRAFHMDGAGQHKAYLGDLGLTPGTYLVEMQTTNERKVEKLVVR
jgi:hypothetical protein